MTNRADLADAALVGWREKVADGLSGPLSSRTPLSEEDARSLVGAVLFALSLYYVVTTVARAVRAARA